jgi:hypothetical protein
MCCEIITKKLLQAAITQSQKVITSWNHSSLAQRGLSTLISVRRECLRSHLRSFECNAYLSASLRNRESYDSIRGSFHSIYLLDMSRGRLQVLIVVHVPCISHRTWRLAEHVGQIGDRRGSPMDRVRTSGTRCHQCLHLRFSLLGGGSLFEEDRCCWPFAIG